MPNKKLIVPYRSKIFVLCKIEAKHLSMVFCHKLSALNLQKTTGLSKLSVFVRNFWIFLSNVNYKYDFLKINNAVPGGETFR